MIKPTITHDSLILEVEGADKVWAFKSSLTMPLKHITEVRLDSEVVKKWWHGFKAPGADIPGLITAGTFYQKGKRMFWDIHHPEKAVVITLKDEKYNELVIEVEHPDLLVNQLNSLL